MDRASARSAIAVLISIQAASSSLSQLIRELKEAPTALLALSNDLSDLQLLLQVEVTKISQLNGELQQEGYRGPESIL
jgi:hypothetical protein